MLTQRFLFNVRLIKERVRHHLFLSLFILVLTISIVLGLANSSYSQAGTPTQTDVCDQTPQVLCEEIKQLAREDVEAEISRRTVYAIDRFKALHPDWQSEPSRVELSIGKIYDTEYTQQTEANQRNPWKAFQSQFENGFPVWLLLIVAGILGAVLKDTFTQWVTGFFKAIDDWIYSRYAGSRLFRNVALTRYRKALVEKYKYLHIPFRTKRSSLNMSEIYVPLKVEGSGGVDQVNAYDAIAQHRRLMVKGRPGSGKSMLLKYLALSYGNGYLSGVPDQPVPILLELHRLSDPALTRDGLIQALVDAFERNDFPNAGRFIKQSLQQGTLMLLLDGLDEVNSDIRPVVVRQIIDLLDRCEACRVVITCRTAVYHGEFDSITQQTLEVVEFRDQQIRRFLGAWEREMPPDKSVDQLIQTLRDRPRIMALARNPLLLTIIAYLYTDTPFILPHSRAEFYLRSTDVLLEQWQRDFNRFKGSEKRRVLQHLALYNLDQSQQQHQDRRSLSYTTVLDQVRAILPTLNRNPETDTISILDEIVERSGLFLKIDGGDRYQFAHLTLQEYFAAAALTDDLNGLVTRFQTDPDTWREVVKLWCGLEGNRTAFIQAIHFIDPITSFECLADAQQVDQALADEIINEFKDQLGVTKQQEILARAFGAVAADTRPRGKAVFAFLEAILANPQESTRHQAVANALSMTNLPQAASVLARYYTTLPVAHDPLVRMGDLAVPELAPLANQQQQTALDDLFAIGTPDAAIALLPMLWNTNYPFVSTVAWYLAGLLPQTGVEEALRECSLEQLGYTKEQEKFWKPFEWLWQPFAPNPTLTMITGRIAYALVHGGLPYSIPTRIPQIDLRLVIPLCAIETIHQLTFPQNWRSVDAESLVASPGSDPVFLVVAQHSYIELALGQKNQQTRWRSILSGLPPRLQLGLLDCLMTAQRLPTKQDWRNIFRSVKYDLRTGWHYRGVLCIAVISSIIAIWGTFTVFTQHSNSWIGGLSAFSVSVILLFWLSLRRGIEQHWEPDVLVKLGFLGPVTFRLELRQLFQTRLVAPVIQCLFKSLDQISGTASIIFGVVVGASVFAFTEVFIFAFAVAFAIVSAVAFAVVGASVFTLAFAIVGAITFAGAGTGAVAGAVAGAAGFGLGAWYRFKPKYNEQKRVQDWLRFVAVLALPWFCWLPITLIFSTIGFHNLLSQFSPLSLATWQQTILVEVLLIGLGSILWWRGRYLDQIARNPLQGGIVEQAIRVASSTSTVRR